MTKSTYNKAQLEPAKPRKSYVLDFAAQAVSWQEESLVLWLAYLWTGDGRPRAVLRE